MDFKIIKNNEVEFMSIHEGDSKISNEQFLEIVGKIAELFHDAISIENTVAITDKEKFVRVLNGKEAEGFPDLTGKPFPNAGNIPAALKTGTKQSSIIPKQVYGAVFKSSTVSIENDNREIIGSLSVALSLKGQTVLQEVVQDTSLSVEQLSSSVEEISSSAALLSSDVENVLTETKEITNLIEQINSILDFVNSVATNSRLLGLNASIEAARAGEAGKGFEVVAGEIRKMAEHSKKSVDDTKKIISTINNKVSFLLKNTTNLSNYARAQAAATEQILASIDNMTSSIGTLKKVSEII